MQGHTQFVYVCVFTKGEIVELKIPRGSGKLQQQQILYGPTNNKWQWNEKHTRREKEKSIVSGGHDVCI